jgi:hypothetical protein
VRCGPASCNGLRPGRLPRQMWNAVPTTGVLQLTMDPATGGRRSIFMNQVGAAPPRGWLRKEPSAFGVAPALGAARAGGGITLSVARARWEWGQLNCEFGVDWDGVVWRGGWGGRCVQRFASIFGYHREELLTRMIQREVSRNGAGGPLLADARARVGLPGYT